MQQVTKLSKRSKCISPICTEEKTRWNGRGNHQGVIAQVAAYQYAEMDDLFAQQKRKMKPLSFYY